MKKSLIVWLSAVLVCLLHILLFFVLPIPRVATTWAAFGALHFSTLVCALITTVTYARLGGKYWHFGITQSWLLGIYWVFSLILSVVTYIVCAHTEMQMSIVLVVAGLLLAMALVLQLMLRVITASAIAAERRRADKA